MSKSGAGQGARGRVSRLPCVRAAPVGMRAAHIAMEVQSVSEDLAYEASSGAPFVPNSNLKVLWPTPVPSIRAVRYSYDGSPSRLRSGDSLDASVRMGQIVLTPRHARPVKSAIVRDAVTGLPVLSVGRLRNSPASRLRIFCPTSREISSRCERAGRAGFSRARVSRASFPVGGKEERVTKCLRARSQSWGSSASCPKLRNMVRRSFSRGRFWRE